MKKKNLKYLLFIICLCIFNMDNVFAFNARVGTTTSHSTGESQGYYDIAIFYNGAEYKQAGYCANEGLNLPNYYDKDTGLPEPMNYNCQVINDPEIYKILTSGGSHGDKQRNLWNYIQNGTTSTSPNGTLLTRIGESGHTITYSINSAIDPTRLSITCGTGCASTSISDMILTVTLQENACSFTINVTYSGPTIDLGTTTTGGKVLHCTRNSNTEQDVYMPIDGETGNTDQKNLTFSDSLNWCDNIPNKCNQKTEVQIPTYCDSAKPESKTITITAPTDVQYCILNSNDDAGNTYQMNDEQLKKDTLGGGSNPYCSVWCKEDYKMEMPGAQYTTSGRYFELENTKVHGTKSCYATNADKNNDEPQINIEKYVEDIKKWQVEVVNRYNAYQLAKANVESAKAATLDDSIVSCSCKKNEGGVYKDTSVDYTNHAYTGPIVNYKKAVATLENAKTGKYRVTMTDASTSANYGYKWSCNGGDSCGATKNIYGKETLQEYIDIMNEALASLKEAQIKLQDTIQFMENCYSWVNEFCMNPEVVFDYNEQYISNKDFVLKSGSTEIIEENATYSSAKQIDKSYNADQGGNLEDIPYAFCEENTCMNGGKGTAQKISTLETHLYYRKIVAENTLEYNNDQEFASKYPQGTIEEAPEGSEGPFKNYEYLGAVFPVALKTPIGVYKWKLNFTNLGQYSNEPSCRNGRLDDVVAVVQSGKGLSADVQYVCVYVVDCPECKYKCVCPENLPDGVTCKEENLECIFDTKDCPECEVRCINCIFDGDDTIYYRTISLNYDTDDLNPNNRELGPNWNKDTNEKAKDTLKEMEKGEKAYEQAEYTFVITPAHMKAIRDYNRDTGTYVAEDLTYGEVDGVSNIAGYSKFLRGDSTQYSDSAYNRTFFKSAKLNSKWELWTSGIKDAVVPINNNLGPAWK